MSRSRAGISLSWRIDVVVAAVLCVAFSGCGNGLSQVTGTVSVDGEPLRGTESVKATVYFQQEGGGATAVGLVDSQGQYKLSTGSQDGVPPGEYLVTVSATQIIPAATPGGTPSGKRITDPKYASAKTSGLRFSVTEGSNQYDIALESSVVARRP